MKVMLAPMEGVVDHLMRDMLTAIGGYDLCVTEFVRIVDQAMPDRVFQRICPELLNHGYTASGTPVRVQLLGQSPQWLAVNAKRAVELGSHGIDLNFGCPAKTVNNHRGGAVLLKEPDKLYDIIYAVRQAVPAGQPVSAKIRLGFDNTDNAVANAKAVEQAGADMLVIHARTKTDGYRPPAYWDWIARIRQHIAIPVVANGEIWSRQDALRCQQQSACDDVMLGRGALALPNLAQVVKGNQTPMDWPTLQQLLIRYSGFEVYGDKGKYYPNRIKQWLGYLSRQYPQANELFNAIRRLQHSEDIVAVIGQQ